MSGLNETEFIFYVIGFYAVGYFMAHLFRTMGKTWAENPAYVLTGGVFGGVFGMIVVVNKPNLNNLKEMASREKPKKNQDQRNGQDEIREAEKSRVIELMNKPQASQKNTKPTNVQPKKY